eukprot:s1397_g3.t1
MKIFIISPWQRSCDHVQKWLTQCINPGLHLDLPNPIESQELLSVTEPSKLRLSPNGAAGNGRNASQMDLMLLVKPTALGVGGGAEFVLLGTPPDHCSSEKRTSAGCWQDTESRVLDLETSLARRGAVGGRQRLGETVEDQVQQQLDRRDEEVKTMREAVIELSSQVAEKEAQLASNQERLADFVNAQSSAPVPPLAAAAPRHYPGGWQPPGAAAAPALPAAPEAVRKAEALGQEMWELQRLRMQQLSRQMEDKVEEHRATSLDALESQWSQWILRITDAMVCGNVHVTAQSDEAAKVLQLPGRGSGPRLAMVDRGNGSGNAMLRLYASQGDKTAAMEVHSECSKATANDEEFSFEIFGFAGPQRSAPNQRPDLRIECKKLQTATGPKEQFTKWSLSCRW